MKMAKLEVLIVGLSFFVLNWALLFPDLVCGSNAYLITRLIPNFESRLPSRERVFGLSGKYVRTKRTPARHVGAVMAILGTFNEAGVLPPEGDLRANQLMRSLIQFQSAFMKSQEPAVHEYFSSGLMGLWGERGSSILESFYFEGWTSESLEAVVEYSEQQSMWEDPHVAMILRSYNLSEEDWALIQDLFLKARQRFRNRHQDIHAVFGQQRRGFPGG